MSGTRARIEQTAEASAGPAPVGAREVVRRGPLDTAGVEEILGRLEQLPWWPVEPKVSNVYRLRAAEILGWLGAMPGGTWQDRWEAAEHLHDAKWRGHMAESLIAVVGVRQGEAATAVGLLIQIRLFRPSYRFLTDFRPRTLYTRVRCLNSPSASTGPSRPGGAKGWPAGTSLMRSRC